MHYDGPQGTRQRELPRGARILFLQAPAIH
jgi:hypothetical protein